MTSNLTILVVDDESAQREMLAGHLKDLGYKVHMASSAAEALAKLDRDTIDLVLTDHRMPGATGLDLLRDLKKRNPDTSVVVMTAYGTVDGAVAAIKGGADDYLQKPIDFDALELLIRRVRANRRLVSENRRLRQELKERTSLPGIVGESQALQDVLSVAGRVADSDASVLIRGESGTGKELVARMIHDASARAAGPFIAVNCAALNENLLESELFGHEKGAFTGADRQRKGRFEAADGGTIFLDEIGDVAAATQVKLLRVLQVRTIDRVGGHTPIPVDVRILAATNRDLEVAIRGGSFREDLYYRLNVVSIEIPPLRNRRQDIPALIDHFIRKFCGKRKKPLQVSREAMDRLTAHDFPGNIRELENIVQRACVLTRSDLITTEDLPLTLQPGTSEREVPTKPRTLKDHLERVERELILRTLDEHGGNQSKAAKALGISESNLRFRLAKLRNK
ncbi:MAG: sigma-54 dependent transcriptional regulator [Bacteroidetes bacterium]|jgi:two-component system NtrC family response regulator|nr:sigma-54 dependent transcriptional regulator [Bacteroidota bacterium]